MTERCKCCDATLDGTLKFGNIPAIYLAGECIICPTCNGEGFIGLEDSYNCPECHGRGWIVWEGGARYPCPECEGHQL